MFTTAFILGLLGSFHCLGMCGPIAFVLPLNRERKIVSITQSFLYHFGRLISYASIGLLFGFLGKELSLMGLQQNLSIIVGVLMILLVVLPNSFLNKFSITKPIYIWVGKIQRALGIYLKKSSLKAFFVIGILNGYLPCGLVYMALFAAIAMESSINGALYMLIFGLGTIPMMMAALFFGNFLKIAIRHKIQRAIPIFVIIIGVLFILRGLGLGIPYISPAKEKLRISSKPMRHHSTHLINYLDASIRGIKWSLLRKHHNFRPEGRGIKPSLLVRRSGTRRRIKV